MQTLEPLWEVIIGRITEHVHAPHAADAVDQVAGYWEGHYTPRDYDQATVCPAPESALDRALPGARLRR